LERDIEGFWRKISFGLAQLLFLFFCYLDVFTNSHFIEGAKIELNKPVTQVFQVTHRFLLGSHNDYNFASFYAHSKVSPSLPTFQ